ncbi:hypothetical protein RJD38_05980 [Vibrio scophthalmi]|uniref:hypothetical protein n=1 Tax=Vibrio scophthalmi TaxID=45658 RepID=UPI00349F920F
MITGFDGYFKNAVVFEDINDNGKLDPKVDTVFGLTNNKGQITLSKDVKITHHLALKTLIPGEMSKELAIKLATASSTIDTYSDFMDVYTTDMDHEGQPMANSVVFRAPTNGSIDNAVISPLTDLVAIEMQKSGVDIEAATAAVSANLGVTDEQPVDLFSDFVKDSATNLASAKLHKTAQILTESKAKNPADYATNAATITEKAADTSEALVTEKNMGSDELLNTKPVIDPSAPSIVITNIKLLINNAAKAEVAKQFAELNLQENTAATHDILLPENLFVDNFGDGAISVPVEKAAINGSGVTVKLENNLLTIDTAGLQLSQEQFIVTLTASDRNEANGSSLNELSVAFVIDIELSNTAPTVSNEYQTSLQTQISNWELKQGVQFSQQLDLMGLFDDREGDNLIYTTDINAVIPGLTAKHDQQTGKITISGRPLADHIAGKKFTIIANDGHVKTRITSQPAGFTLPVIAEGTITAVPGMQEKMQEVVNSWELQVAKEFDQTLDVSELFTSDISGDTEYYAHYAAHDNQPAENPIHGVQVSVDQTTGLVTLKGKPTKEATGVILYIAKGVNFSGGDENDIESEMIQIKLPDVQSAELGSIEINHDARKKLNDKAASWAHELQVGKLFDQTLDISGLFLGDFDGTAEYYANYAEHDHSDAENPINGVKVEVDANGLVTLYGTPTRTTDSVKLYVAKGFNIFGGNDNDIESEMVAIPLPNVQPGEDVTPPSEGHPLEGQPLYFLEWGNDYENGGYDHTRVWCDSTLYKDGKVFSNTRTLTNLTTCSAPTEEVLGASYVIENEKLIASFPSEDKPSEIEKFTLEVVADKASIDIAPSAKTVIFRGDNEAERYTYFSQAAEAEASINILSNDSWDKRFTKIYMPADTDNTWEPVTVSVALDQNRAYVNFDADGKDFTCETYNEWYAFRQLTDGDNSYVGGCTTLIDDEENNPGETLYHYASVYFDLSQANVEVGKVYSFISTAQESDREYAESVKLNIKWTGESDND